MTDLDWRTMLIQLHGRGLTWRGVAYGIGMSDAHIERYVRDCRGLRVTPERGRWIMKAHEFLCPEAFRNLPKP